MKLLTLARDLQRRKARERSGLFLAEGARAAEELLRSGARITGALAAPSLLTAPRGSAVREALAAAGITVQDVTEREFASAAGTDSPQGILVIAEAPTHSLGSLRLPASPRFLLLDAIQDPGNAGTMIRTAAAFGVTATLALPGTVDVWNGKVVRSAMGALFRHPVVSCTWEAAEGFLAAHDVPLWGADPGGDPMPTAALPRALALAVGNEGGGLSVDARARATRLLAIPIAPDVESLNAAVAAGILLYQFRP